MTACPKIEIKSMYEPSSGIRHNKFVKYETRKTKNRKDEVLMLVGLTTLTLSLIASLKLVP